MFYIAMACPICEQGMLGFCRCSDGKRVVILCDTCTSVWTNPHQIAKGNASAAPIASLEVREIGCVLTGGQAGWATKDEILQVGWSSEIAGEWFPPHER